MQLDNKTLKYLKCRQSSGKNRFARTMDLILGTAVSLVILFCLLWSNGKGIVGSIILAATVSLAGAVLFLIIGKYRFERFLSRYLDQIRQNAVLEKITLLPARQFRAI